MIFERYPQSVYTLSDITWALEAFAPIIMSAQIMSGQIVSAHSHVHKDFSILNYK